MRRLFICFCLCGFLAGCTTPEEIRDWQQRAEKGDSQAQFYLSGYHAGGHAMPDLPDMPRDPQKAEMWLKASA